jgi:SAM-dependent methyltransferase
MAASDSPLAGSTATPVVFDRRLIRARRDRAQARFGDHDFLVREVAARLVDRLEDVQRRFPTALDLGAHRGGLAESLAGRFGIETLVQTEFSPAFARGLDGLAVAADEEWLPFAAARFDLVVSALALHRVNDLPGALIQANRSLKPDGLFLAALPGGETLKELRHAFMEAEAAIDGGVSPRVAPFVDVRDAGALLQRAGFALPVADLDNLTVTYADPFALMRELRGMGESNALAERRRAPLRRTTLAKVAEAYRDLYGLADGRVPATVQIVWLTGWAPAPSQPKPARRGSATVRLADALKAIAAEGDQPPPPTDDQRRK